MAAPRYVTIDGNKKKLATSSQTNTGVAVVVSTDEDGFIDPSFLRDSEVVIKTASESLSAGDAVNIFDDTGVAKVRRADASAFATRAMGFVLDNFDADDPATVISEGIIGGFAGLTIGDPVFLSLTSGEITQTPPTATNEIWQQLGSAYSATELRLEIGEAIVL